MVIRRSQQNGIFFLCVSFLLSLLGAAVMGVPRTADAIQIRVSASGTPNSFSGQQNITILGVTVSDVFYPADTIFSGDWKKGADGSLQYVPWEAASPSVEGQVPAGEAPRILFLSHLWSGNAVVDVEGICLSISSYTATDRQTLSVALPAAPHIGARAMLCFLALLLLSLLVYRLANRLFFADVDIIHLLSRQPMRFFGLLGSGVLLTSLMALVASDPFWIWLSAMISVPVYCLLLGRTGLLKAAPTLATRVISLCALCMLYRFFLQGRWSAVWNACSLSGVAQPFMTGLIFIGAFPMCCALVYALITRLLPLLTRALHALDRFERRFLMVGGAVAALLLLLIYTQTSAFSEGLYLQPDGTVGRQYADQIYGYDHSWVLDSFSTIDYHILNARHPLIRVFTLFPAAFGKLLQAAFQPLFPQVYGFLWAMVSAGLMLCSAVLLKRITQARWIAPLYALSYFFILLCLGAEQYQISLFFLLLSVYYALRRRSTACHSSMLLMSGMTLTSGYLVPILTPFQNLKQYLLSLVRYCAAFAGLLFTCGTAFSISPSQLAALSGAMGTQTNLLHRVQIYTHFITWCFVSPAAHEIWPSAGNALFTAESPAGAHPVGVLLLLACTVSFYLHRRDMLCRICALSGAFSAILCIGIGWAVHEAWLYAILFSWAFFILLWKLALRFLHDRAHRQLAFAVALCLLLFFNLPKLGELFAFCMRHYAVLGETFLS